MMRITECFKWHVVGEIIDVNPAPVEVPENYFEEIEMAYKKKREEANHKVKQREEERSRKTDELRKAAEAKRKEYEQRLHNVVPETSLSEGKHAISKEKRFAYELLALSIGLIVAGGTLYAMGF